MLKKTNNIASDLQAAGNLTIDAIIGITDIAEALHSKIVSLGGIIGDSETDKPEWYIKVFALRQKWSAQVLMLY